MKQWLEENKIYFETAAATLLGVMAVLVSISQLLVAQSQLRIARENASPSIYADVTQIKNSKTGQYEEEKLRVYNRGAPAYSTESTYAIWLLVELRSRSGNIDSTKLKIALSGYYGSTMVTQNPEGLMFEIQGYKNHLKLSILEREFTKLAKEKGYFTELNIRRYIHISYRDRFGDRHNEYFLVETIGGSEKIPKYIGKKQFEEHRSDLGGRHSAEFSNLTAEALLDIALDK